MSGKRAGVVAGTTEESAGSYDQYKYVHFLPFPFFPPQLFWSSRCSHVCSLSHLCWPDGQGRSRSSLSLHPFLLMRPFQPTPPINSPLLSYPAMNHLDTSWCPVCSRQILPKRYLVPVTQQPSIPSPIPAPPPSSPTASGEYIPIPLILFQSLTFHQRTQVQGSLLLPARLAVPEPFVRKAAAVSSVVLVASIRMAR